MVPLCPGKVVLLCMPKDIKTRTGLKTRILCKHPDLPGPPLTPAPIYHRLFGHPDADERDRIDYIYYADNSNRVSVDESIVFGPSGSIVRGQGYEDATYTNPFVIPTGTWPSDHKGVITTFSITTVQPTVGVNKTAYLTGETITVNFANGSTHPQAWVGIYQNGKVPGTSNYATAWKYTNGVATGSTTLTLPANSPSGTYFVAYFNDNGYVEIAPRVSFTYGN